MVLLSKERLQERLRQSRERQEKKRKSEKRNDVRIIIQYMTLMFGRFVFTKTSLSIK